MIKHDLRIVFMGTPDFAVATLDALVTNGYNIVGVITAPDRPAGRGQKMNASAVKKYAVEKNLTVLQPTNLKDEQFLKELKDLEANLQIVVAFRMLPAAVWQMPKLGTFNLHASLLPDYRGAAPINWAIINGDTKTGNTTFFIDEKIDTGAIIMQEETPIAPDENAGSLHDRLMASGAALVLKTVGAIENDTVTTSIQPQTEDFKTAYKIHKDTCKLDWNEDINVLYNKIRGLSPYPGAWCELVNNDKTTIIKIYATTKELCNHDYTAGTIITDKKTVKVAVNGGFLCLNQLQLAGKKKMDVVSLLNGFQIEKNASMR